MHLIYYCIIYNSRLPFVNPFFRLQDGKKISLISYQREAICSAKQNKPSGNLEYRGAMLLSSMMSSWFSLVKAAKLHARSREKRDMSGMKIKTPEIKEILEPKALIIGAFS